MKKIFIAILYLIWIASFILLCCECENAFVFITSKFIASFFFVISTFLIQKYD